MKILCIIPARCGSKGIKDKNIKMFNGRPLLTWSIKQAQNSKYYSSMRIIVSTDSKKYAAIARKYGAEVPFIRPHSISGDFSTDYECIKHCLTELLPYTPDIILQLRPTQPCRKVSDIDKTLSLFMKNRDKYDSLRTVIEYEKSAFKMYTVSNNCLNPLFKMLDGIKEPYNTCRQSLKQCYLHNGYIDIINSDIVRNGILSGNKILPYIMSKNDNIDIDTVDDWIKAEQRDKEEKQKSFYHIVIC